MKRKFLFLLASCTALFSHAQMTIWPAGDPALAVLNHLAGPNVSLSNVFSQTIDPNQYGIFHDSTSTLGVDSGLVLSTGICYGVIGPNTIPNATIGGGQFGGDPDLMTMSPLYPSSLGDPGIVQMDLVPLGDTLTVRYVFGSEEYDEYACSSKDDRMGMFLSGPGLGGAFTNGGINMATLPISGLPVTVNTLNRGTAGSEGNLGLCGMNPGWEQDTIYYINNDFGIVTQLDGYTVVLTAKAVVQPGATYHLKIAIADVNDANFDSAIFLPEGAISCTELSTGIDHSGWPAQQNMWFDALARVVNIGGFTAEGGPVQVEAFDPSGRLLQRSAAQANGASCVVPIIASASGIIIIHATQRDRVVTGRVFVR